jgi:hypothetical protein
VTYAFAHTTGVLVAGCTSHGLSGMFLFSLSYASPSPVHEPSSLEVNSNASSVLAGLNDVGATLEVRAGYLGMCVSSEAGWVCSRSSEQLARIFQQAEVDGPRDPLNLIYIADTFKREMAFVGLLCVLSAQRHTDPNADLADPSCVALSLLSLAALPLFSSPRFLAGLKMKTHRKRVRGVRSRFLPDQCLKSRSAA